MNRRNSNWWLAMGLVTLVTPVTAWASGSASIGLTLNIGDAPPPPVVVIREEPRCVVVPGSTVYVVQNRIPYDMFRYGVFWYVYNDGYWYRARAYAGPFRPIEVRYVPRAIISVPSRHWRHHPHGGPPGQAKKHGGNPNGGSVAKNGRGHGHDDD